jgi:hypothetical protein
MPDELVVVIDRVPGLRVTHIFYMEDATGAAKRNRLIEIAGHLFSNDMGDLFLLRRC